MKNQLSPAAIANARASGAAYGKARLRAVQYLKRMDPGMWRLLVEEARIEQGLPAVPQGGHK